MTRTVLLVVACAVLVASVTAGVAKWRADLIATGDQAGANRVLAQWAEQIKAQNEQTEKDNQERTRHAAEIAAQIQALEADRDAARADAAAARGQLREQIARLNARPNPYPVTDAGLAACAGDATTARELLGESASALVDLAAEADRLVVQVTGLQAFARDVCRAGKTLAHHDE